MPTTWYKPAGTPVFPPHDDPSGASCAAAIAARWPARAEAPWPDGFALGIAHRLDTPTSGALLLADAPDELAAIRALFAAGALRKVYRFEAARDVAWIDHEITAPIAHDKRHKGRMVVQRGASTPHRGRFLPAHTTLRHLGDRLWEAVITTGVMHQIRVHAAFVGVPLAGDRRYGGGARPEGFEADFRLHHVGLTGPDGLRTDPVPLPAWARLAGEPASLSAS
jgi:23S rRNA pseudouridine1911/1915/1917 synthase